MSYLFSSRAIGAVKKMQRQYRLAALMERDGKRCQHCGCRVQIYKVKDGQRQPKDMATEDHKVPRSRGGTDDLSNLLLACFDCNNRRGNQSLETFALSQSLRRELGH